MHRIHDEKWIIRIFIKRRRGRCRGQDIADESINLRIHICRFVRIDVLTQYDEAITVEVLLPLRFEVQSFVSEAVSGQLEELGRVPPGDAVFDFLGTVEQFEFE